MNEPRRRLNWAEKVRDRATNAERKTETRHAKAAEAATATAVAE